MNRRNFLSKLGIGTSAVAATAIFPRGDSKIPDPAPQPTLRPKCACCSTLMLVRWEGSRPTANCPNTNCKKYGKSLSLGIIEEKRKST
jgi:hypothetical protein